MKDYKVQKGCANCAHCLKLGFDWPYYYCNVNKDLPEHNEVPTVKFPQGNLFEVEKREYTLEEDEKIFAPRFDAWSAWQNKREVKPHVILS